MSKGTYVRTEVFRKEMSVLRLGHPVSDITKLKISLSMIGKKTRQIGDKVKHTNGYTFIYKPDNLNCNKQGYIYEHRLVMEEFLGRFLNRNEIIHHINGETNDNRIENLMLFVNRGEHTKYEWSLRKQVVINKDFQLSYCI